MPSRNNPDARFSTYSGAPSLHPSLAPTLDTQATANRSSTHNSLIPRSTTTPNLTTADKSHRAVYGSQHAMASSSTMSSGDPKNADIKSWSGALERMNDERLDKQRYIMDPKKSEEVSKNALGAKVERALGRRLTGQDATMRPKRKPTSIDVEKRGLEVKAI